MVDIHTITLPKYVPKLEYGLIPKRIAYLESLSVLSAARQGYKIIYPS